METMSRWGGYDWHHWRDDFERDFANAADLLATRERLITDQDILTVLQRDASLGTYNRFRRALERRRFCEEYPMLVDCPETERSHHVPTVHYPMDQGNRKLIALSGGVVGLVLFLSMFVGFGVPAAVFGFFVILAAGIFYLLTGPQSRTSYETTPTTEKERQEAVATALATRERVFALWKADRISIQVIPGFTVSSVPTVFGDARHPECAEIHVEITARHANGHTVEPRTVVATVPTFHASDDESLARLATKAVKEVLDVAIDELATAVGMATGRVRKRDRY